MSLTSYRAAPPRNQIDSRSLEGLRRFVKRRVCSKSCSRSVSFGPTPVFGENRPQLTLRLQSARPWHCGRGRRFETEDDFAGAGEIELVARGALDEAGVGLQC